MRKGLIAVIIVASIGLASVVIILMKVSASKARKESNKILEKFKTIDKDLKTTSIAIDSANKILNDSLSQNLNK